MSAGFQCFCYYKKTYRLLLFTQESIILIKQGTKPRMDMVQCKTTIKIEILKLNTETDSSVLILLSLSASCLLGKVTASVACLLLLIFINSIFLSFFHLQWWDTLRNGHNHRYFQIKTI